MINLRRFRNKFFKYYIQSDHNLSAEDLSALVLYFALFFLDSKQVLSKLFKSSALALKRIEELDDNEISVLGREFLDLLDEILPLKLKDVMVVPNKAAWCKARQFYIEIEQPQSIFADIANLGFAYQIFSSGSGKKNALFALQKANKTISREELIAFTQLYTPTWVVDFLVANTILSGIVSSDTVLSGISSGIVLLGNGKELTTNRYWRWLIPDQNYFGDKNNILKNDTGFKNNIDLKDFSLLDPACGAGQFLFSAFDLLMELYSQKGYEKQMAAKLILNEHIFGADIDEKALWVAILGLFSKYLVVSESIDIMPGRLNNLDWVRVTDLKEEISEANFLGSIDDRLPNQHFLKNKHSVLLTNPPYIGRRCLSRELKVALKEQYPNSSADLSAAFLERCLAMLKPNGGLGMITQSSLMSIPSYKTLREYLLGNFYMQAAIHCGPGVFPLASGEKIDSILLLVREKGIISQGSVSNKTCLVDLTGEKDKCTKLENALNRLSVVDGRSKSKKDESANFIDQVDFLSGIPSGLLSKLSSDFYTKINKLPKLGDIADIRQGLATTDNGKFVRYRFDVDEDLIGNTWVPYVKGAGGERYISVNPFVVKWGNNGEEIKNAVANAYPYLKGKTAWVVKNEEFYFRSGLCFSFINKSGLAVRKLPAGAIFDVASSAIFTLPEEEGFLLAYLNSRVIGLIAKGINQTINIQVGDLKKIPIIPVATKLKNEISDFGNLAFQIKSQLIDSPLTLFEFQTKLEFQPKKLHAHDLSVILEEHVKLRSRLTDELSSIQKKIDNAVIEAMESCELIDASEKAILYEHVSLPETEVLNEKKCAHMMLNRMVSNIISSDKGDKLALIPMVNNEGLMGLLNLTTDGLDWFENKLGISIAKMFSQAKVTDISKLAGEPSRYFIYYLTDCNSCMLFSSSAARHFKKDTSTANIFNGQESTLNFNLLDKINMLWGSIFAKLDIMVDWTSKDLFVAFESIRF